MQQHNPHLESQKKKQTTGGNAARWKITLIKLLWKQKPAKQLKPVHLTISSVWDFWRLVVRNTAASHINRQRETIIGLGPGLRFYIIGYGSYTRILHENQTEMQMLGSTLCQKQGSSFASQCNVPTDRPCPHRPQTPPTPARIKTNTLKKRAARIFTFSSETDN